MNVDELLREKAHELQEVHSGDIGQPDLHEGRNRIGSRSNVWALAAAALGVLMLFAPIAILRSGDPTPGETTPVSSANDPTSPGSSGELSLGERLYKKPGDGGLGPIMVSGSDLVVTGWDVVLTSRDQGDTWDVTGASPEGDDSLIQSLAADGTLLAIGAHDGTGSRLYRSADGGATWEQIVLPVSPEIDGVVPGVVAHHDQEWIVSGVARGSSESDTKLYLWRSPDARNWELEAVADLEGGFVYNEVIEKVDDRLVIIARGASDTRAELLAFEETSNGWMQTGLTPVLETLAGLESGPVNSMVKGAGIVDGRLHVWWSFFDQSLDDQMLAAVTHRTGPGEWEAEPIAGTSPETITSTSDALIGTAHPGTLAPMLTPEFTSIVRSADGITWNEIGRVDGIYLGRVDGGYLGQLHVLDEGQFIAAGNETEPSDEGFVRVISAGIWKLSLAADR